jgi:hypothetical protein
MIFRKSRTQLSQNISCKLFNILYYSNTRNFHYVGIKVLINDKYISSLVLAWHLVPFALLGPFLCPTTEEKNGHWVNEFNIDKKFENKICWGA